MIRDFAGHTSFCRFCHARSYIVKQMYVEVFFEGGLFSYVLCLFEKSEGTIFCSSMSVTNRKNGKVLNNVPFLLAATS